MKSLSLNRNQIKYVVIAAMLIDHIAWAWVPTASPLGQVMHAFGRLTGATMAFFVAEGYIHTRNVKRYALRLALFALLSWPAFCLFEFGVLPVRFLPGHLTSRNLWCFYLASRELTLVIYPFFGVIYSLLLGLLAVWLWDSDKCHLLVKLIGIAILLYLSQFGDWQYFDVLWALVFFIYRDKPVKKWLFFSVIAAFVYLAFTDWTRPTASLFQLGVYLVPLLLIVFYNGRGGSKSAVHKWFFYIFYPAHLLLLAWLRFGLKL